MKRFQRGFTLTELFIAGVCVGVVGVGVGIGFLVVLVHFVSKFW